MPATGPGAPPLSVTPPNGPFSYTVQPILLRGFRINVSLSQATASPPGDWSVSISTQIVDLAQVAVPDRTFSASKSETIPGNEAPLLADVLPKVQEMVDAIYNQIPTP